MLHCAAANVHAQKAIHCVSKHVLRCQGHILLLRAAPYDQGRKWKKNTKGKQMVLAHMLPGLRVLNARGAPGCTNEHAEACQEYNNNNMLLYNINSIMQYLSSHLAHLSRWVAMSRARDLSLHFHCFCSAKDVWWALSKGSYTCKRCSCVIWPHLCPRQGRGHV